MSSHDFDRRYRLLKVVAQADGVRTHNAQEVTTGRVVMVHMLDDAGPSAVDMLGRRLARLPDAEKTRVLETATLSAGYAVVTEFIPGLQSFSAWLNARVGEEPLSTATPAAAPIARAGAQATTEPAILPARGLLAPDDPLADEADSEPPQALAFTVGGDGAPGEFTRLFMASGKLNLETTPAPAAPPAAPKVAPPVAPPPAAPEPVAAPVAGSFTALFGAPSVPVAAPAPLADPTPPAPVHAPTVPAPPAAHEPGLFTQMFGAPQLPPAPVHPTPTPAIPVPLTPAPAPAPAAAPAPDPLAPGEFTRMFQAGTPAPLAGASASPLVGPPTPAPSRSAAPPPPPPMFNAPPQAASPMFAPAPTAAPASGPLPPLHAGATSALAAQLMPVGASPLAAFGGAIPVPAAPPPGPVLPPAAPPAAFASAPGQMPMLTPPAFQRPLAPAAVAGGAPEASTPFGVGAPSAPAGGSEYTRLVRQSTTPPPPSVSAPPIKPALPPAAARAPIPLPLIIAVNLVLLLAAGLILYFVLRPKPPAVVPGAVPTVAVPGGGAVPSAAPPAVPTAR